MNKGTFDFHRQRSFGELFNATFEFLKGNVKPLFRSMAIIAGPGIVVASGLAVLFYFQIMNMINYGESASSPAEIGFLMIMMMLTMGVFLLTYFMLYLAVLSYIKLCEAGETDMSTGRIWKEVKKQMLPYILYSVISSFAFGAVYIVAVVALMVFAMIPVLNVLAGVAVVCVFIFVGVHVVFFLHMVILEDARIEELLTMMKKSYRLMRGHWWPTFGLVVVYNLISNALTYVIYVPVYLIVMLPYFTGTASFEEFEEPKGLIIVFMVTFGISIIATMFLQSIQIIGVSLQYYNLREMKDADKLMEKISSIGTTEEKLAGDKEEDETF